MDRLHTADTQRDVVFIHQLLFIVYAREFRLNERLSVLMSQGSSRGGVNFNPYAPSYMNTFQLGGGVASLPSNHTHTDTLTHTQKRTHTCTY